MKRSDQDILAVLAAMRAAESHERYGETRTPSCAPAPFITISRQAGAGGRSLAGKLVARLNSIDPGDLPWTVWDNELVERVATEYDLPISKVAGLEDERPSWLEQAVGSLALGRIKTFPDELVVYHRVAAAIRTLAEMGRVVIVGRGGAFVTWDMLGGVHLRLVAPLDHRIASTMKALGTSSDQAKAWVRERDQNREAFYRRHWPGRALVPENFTATFNTALVNIEQIAESTLPLLPSAGAPNRMTRIGAVQAQKESIPGSSHN